MVRMRSVEDLIGVFGRLEQIRATFIGLGFKFPEVALNRIESIRVRGEGEKDYAFYSAERLLESLSFPLGRWRRSKRDSIQLAYRSEYIDFLCSRFADRASVFAKDCSDAPTAYAGAMDLNADPNYLIFSRLDLNDDDASRRLALENEELLAKEVDHFSTRLSPILKGVGSVSVKGIRSMFASAAADANPTLRMVNGRSKVLLETSLGNDWSLLLSWDDELRLRKWGRLDAKFSVVASGDAPDAASSVLECDLRSLIPGGDAYTRTKNENSRVALGVLAHVEMMRVIASFSGDS